MSRPGTVKLDSLKAQRLSAGLSIPALAKKANVSDLTIQTAENGGNIDFAVGVSIAAALGISTATLGQRVL